MKDSNRNNTRFAILVSGIVAALLGGMTIYGRHGGFEPRPESIVRTEIVEVIKEVIPPDTPVGDCAMQLTFHYNGSTAYATHIDVSNDYSGWLPAGKAKAKIIAFRGCDGRVVVLDEARDIHVFNR